MSAIVYPLGDNLYVNLTNRCTAACTFCIKNKWQWQFHGRDLRLEREPSAEEVIAAVGDPRQYGEIVFCGYGEPLLRLEELKKVAAWVKQEGGRVRVNTSGHANLVYGRNVAPELKGLVDAISISLNAVNARDYVLVQRPAHGEPAYKAVLDFAAACRDVIPDVTLTCIDFPGTDMRPCKDIADRLGVKFRLRPYLEEYEDRDA